VMPCRGCQFLEYGRADRCSIRDHLDGATVQRGQRRPAKPTGRGPKPRSALR
jgi:hypothetical protein